MCALVLYGSVPEVGLRTVYVCNMAPGLNV
jgi:hypothetical protein